jgi:hypothetical protein
MDAGARDEESGEDMTDYTDCCDCLTEDGIGQPLPPSQRPQQSAIINQQMNTVSNKDGWLALLFISGLVGLMLLGGK